MGPYRQRQRQRRISQDKMSEVPAEVPVPVKRGSVKLRSSFFEELQASGSPGTDPSPEKQAESKVQKPKWMLDLAKKTDAHNNVVDKQLKTKLRERKMIADGQTPKKLPPKEDYNSESPELAAILSKRREKAED